MTRPSWDTYFIEQCDLIATRSTCSRKAVGAIITKDKRIISSGYNGSLPGMPHCDDPEEYWYCTRCGNKQVREPRLIPGQGHVCETKLSCLGYSMKKCTGGHIIRNNHCVRTIHAEINAITQAAYLGVSTKDTTMYSNTFPCLNCFQAIISSGIKELVYRDEYGDEKSHDIVSEYVDATNFVIRQYQCGITS